MACVVKEKRGIKGEDWDREEKGLMRIILLHGMI